VRELYGGVEEIIEGNNFMRYEGYVRPWPMNWLIIGDDGAGDDHILDLDLVESPVYFLDHELYQDREHLDQAVRQEAPNLASFVEQIKEIVRDLLEHDGVRVDGDPAEVWRRYKRGAIVPETPPLDEALARALREFAGTERGARRVGAIRLLPKEIAAASDVWFYATSMSAASLLSQATLGSEYGSGTMIARAVPRRRACRYGGRRENRARGGARSAAVPVAESPSMGRRLMRIPVGERGDGQP
jgi:hypothetical protein